MTGLESYFLIAVWTDTYLSGVCVRHSEPISSRNSVLFAWSHMLKVASRYRNADSLLVDLKAHLALETSCRTCSLCRINSNRPRAPAENTFESIEFRRSANPRPLNQSTSRHNQPLYQHNIIPDMQLNCHHFPCAWPDTPSEANVQ